ncbi:MAG: TVP38/TMEM64 family protein [bacterium]|nr:TVP38/TMEM64 family protein [bacterium]
MPNNRRRRLVTPVLFTLLVICLIWFGRHLGERIPELETHVAELGNWTIPTFLGLYIPLTLLIVPMTIFALLAGAIFDLPLGIGLVLTGTLLSSLIGFWLARRFGRGRCERWLDRHPRLTAINRLASRRGFRFMFLLRFTPINFTMLNYILGISRVRFGDFLLACLGMLPMHAVLVYAGFVTRQVIGESGAGMSQLRRTIMFGGLAAAIIALILITHYARRALQEDETLEGVGK